MSYEHPSITLKVFHSHLYSKQNDNFTCVKGNKVNFRFNIKTEIACSNVCKMVIRQLEILLLYYRCLLCSMSGNLHTLSAANKVLFWTTFKLVKLSCITRWVTIVSKEKTMLKRARDKTKIK